MEIGQFLNLGSNIGAGWCRSRSMRRLLCLLCGRFSPSFQ
jgi:hypothetical protein